MAMEQRTVLGVCHGCDNERYQQMLTELREIAAAANLRSGRLECLMFIQTLRRIIPEEIKLFFWTGVRLFERFWWHSGGRPFDPSAPPVKLFLASRTLTDRSHLSAFVELATD
jgi:hypothetical protein